MAENIHTKKDTSSGFVSQLATQRQDFCILGLTGRVRSGTSQVCELLTDPMFAKRLPMPDNRNNTATDLDEKAVCEWEKKKQEDEEGREYRIIYRFLRDKWQPFVEVSVTSVIISYCFESEIQEYWNKHSDEGQRSTKGITIERSVNSILWYINAFINNKLCLQNKKTDRRDLSFSDLVQKKILDTDQSLMCSGENRNYNVEKQKEAIEKYMNDCKDIEWVFKEWKKAKDVLDSFSPTDYSNKPGTSKSMDTTNINEESAQSAYYFCYGVLPSLDSIIQDAFKESDKSSDKNAYSFLFQDFGNSIRATGSIRSVCQDEKATDEDENCIINAAHLFDLPSRINQFIKVLRSPRLKASIGNAASPRFPVFVVINNFKNVFETFYFKQRYSAFYLMAVSCDEDTRKDRFSERDMYSQMNLREDLSSGKKVIKRAQKILASKGKKSNEPICKEDLNELAPQFNKPEQAFLNACVGHHNIRFRAYSNNIAPFILQDVVTCVENADIFVTRDHSEPDAIHDHPLRRQLARTVTLLLHPGLLVPTKVERCMQIAMTAKLNSGCLSRQVGAVVTDRHYNILSLGWNDAPCDTEICMRRNLFDLIGKEDRWAFSDYERSDRDFRDYLDVIKDEFNQKKSKLNGLPMAFCFKDIYQDIIKQRDQIYTRALHGEERAIASCRSDSIRGGYLFTTSSPCELCAKRAKEAGISKIYYIQLYPGISKDHVIQIGYPPSRAKYEFFVGATGLAYIKLYTPLIPYKDELAALGYSPSEIYHKIEDNRKKHTNSVNPGENETAGSLPDAGEQESAPSPKNNHCIQSEPQEKSISYFNNSVT